MKKVISAVVLAAVLAPASAAAQQIRISPVVQAIVADETAAMQTQAPPPPFAYSEGYRTRLKIHKISSFTFLPLVGAQGVLGKMIYDNPTPGRRTAHRAVAWTLGGLFAVNSVTGTWNLIESRKDPNGRKRRVIHTILMLASDAGFLATALSRPSSREKDANTYLDDRSTHRTLAIASMSTATVGYLIMLLRK